MNAILQKLFPEGYRKLVATGIVLAIGLGIYLVHGNLPDAVARLLLGGLGIFAGGNVGEWIARALGDLGKPQGFIQARDAVVKAAEGEAVAAAARVVPAPVLAGAQSALGPAVAALQNSHGALAQRLAQVESALGQIMDAQSKQGNAIGGLVQIINRNRAQAAAGPMQAGAAPLNPQQEEG